MRQYHFTAWPDHGVPAYATSLLAFRRKVHLSDDMAHGPIVTHCRWVSLPVSCSVAGHGYLCHCGWLLVLSIAVLQATSTMYMWCYTTCIWCYSAGVGRTGTFILVDILLDQARADGEVDVFGYLKKIREQRTNLVQALVSCCCYV